MYKHSYGGKHYNLLIINALHTSAVGTGFIPVLAAAGQLHGIINTNSTLICNALHTSTVGTGFIPVLAAAGQQHGIINTNSTLIINALYTSVLWAGFIPVLTATFYLSCISPAVGRTGINPAPTAVECHKCLSINGLHKDSKSIH